MVYIRNTKDEYVIQGNYGWGWEDECAEDTRQDARATLRDYRQNGPSYAAYRIVKRRVPIEAGEWKQVNDFFGPLTRPVLLLDHNVWLREVLSFSGAIGGPASERTARVLVSDRRNGKDKYEIIVKSHASVGELTKS